MSLQQRGCLRVNWIHPAVMKFRVLYKAGNILVNERLLAFQGGLCFMKLT
jgi:hypothetical protein